MAFDPVRDLLDVRRRIRAWVPDRLHAFEIGRQIDADHERTLLGERSGETILACSPAAAVGKKQCGMPDRGGRPTEVQGAEQSIVERFRPCKLGGHRDHQHERRLEDQAQQAHGHHCCVGTRAAGVDSGGPKTIPITAEPSRFRSRRDLSARRQKSLRDRRWSRPRRPRCGCRCRESALARPSDPARYRCPARR